jgi:hypothetical protein
MMHPILGWSHFGVGKWPENCFSSGHAALHFTFSTTSVWSSNSTRLKRSRSAKIGVDQCLR